MSNKEYLLKITKQLPSIRALCENAFEQLHLLFLIMNDELDNYIIEETAGSGILYVHHSTPENIQLLTTDTYSKYLIMSKLNGIETIHIGDKTDIVLRSKLPSVSSFKSMELDRE